MKGLKEKLKISNLGEEFSEVFDFSHTHTNTLKIIFFFQKIKCYWTFMLRRVLEEGCQTPGASVHRAGILQGANTWKASFRTGSWPLSTLFKPSTQAKFPQSVKSLDLPLEISKLFLHGLWLVFQNNNSYLKTLVHICSIW